MAYTHEHRFLRKYGLPYYVRLTLPIISEHTGIPVEILQEKAVGNTEKEKIIAVLKSLSHPDALRV
jgi:hypothetical protein